MKKITQTQQVINVLRSVGGYATLRRLNELVDFSNKDSRSFGETYRAGELHEASVHSILEYTG